MKFQDTQITEMDELVEWAERRRDGVRAAVQWAKNAKSYEEWAMYINVARGVLDLPPVAIPVRRDTSAVSHETPANAPDAGALHLTNQPGVASLHLTDPSTT